MRTYLVRLDGGKREERVDVVDRGDGTYDVTIGGQVRRVDAFRADPATLSLIVDRESYAVQLEVAAAGVKVHVRGEAHALEVLDERQLRIRGDAVEGAAPGTKVTAPGAGKVE